MTAISTGQRVVITGGAGFLGSHLCDHYLAAGWDVVAVDNEITGRRQNVAHLADNARFTLMSHDVVSGVPVEGQVDLVLHMASLASPPFYKRLPIETLEVGSTGTQRCLELASRCGARLVFASTSEVYGDPLESPQRETYWGNVNPVGPRSMYDESKRYGEALLTAFRAAKGVNTGIVRIFNTYGPRMRWDDGRVVTSFLVSVIRGEALSLHGDGSQTRSFCYVADLVDGISRFAASSHPGPMNFGNPDNEMTIRDLGLRVADVFGVAARFGPPAPRQDENDPMQRRPDIGLARTVLGWEPKTTLEVGLRATHAYLRAELGDSP
jgi:dTDP-glucose 4,6-dehydratase